jgi:hypothetical protein
MRGLLLASLVVSSGACHWTRYDQKATSPTQMCHACCQQAKDACMLDGDRPGYVCPTEYQECVGACDAGDENQMCVIQTERQLASRAPRPLVTPPSSPSPSSPPAAIAKTAAARGECDNKGTWQLVISEAKGHATHCSALGEIPREVSFRIERRHDEFALSDLAAAPGWSDAFSVANKPDECGVTLKRDNATDAARPRRMTVTMTERNGEVLGTFHYREELPKPAECELDATVTGMLVAPAPRPAPEPVAPRPPRPERIEPPKRGAGSEQR